MKGEDLLVPKILEYLNVGDRENLTVQELLLIVEKAYQDISTALNLKPDIIQQTTDGNPADIFLNQGDLHINLNTNKVEMLTNHPTQNTVTWTTLS